VALALWSIGLAAIGLAASRGAAPLLARRAPQAASRVAWVAGVLALLPAWLVPFVSLLGAAGTVGGPPRLSFLVASAAAILGLIASDALLVRAEQRPAPVPPARGWLLGIVALAPAWLVALLLAVRLPR
jgi:hypothetical protein